MESWRLKELGRVKKYFPDKGFGFIEIIGEKDIYFNKKGSRYEGIRNDDIVLFNLRFNKDGTLTAYNIEKTDLQLELSNWSSIERIRKTTRLILQRTAEEALRELNYGKARQKFIECIKQDMWEGRHPDESVFLAFGDMENRLGRGIEARGIYELGLSYHTTSSKLVSRLAKLYIDAGRYDEALKHLSGFLLSSTSNDEIRMQLLDGLLRLSESNPSKYFSRAEGEAKLLLDEKNRDRIKDRLEFLRNDSSRTLWLLLRNARFELINCKVEHHGDTPLFGYILTRPDKQMQGKYGFNKQLFVYHNYEPISQEDAVTKGIELFNDYKIGKEDSLHQRVFLMLVSDIDEVRELLKKLRENPEANPTIVPISRTGAEAVLDQNANEYVGRLFDEWMSQIDRYRENYPVQGRDFFGRERDLVLLNKNIEAGKPTGIFGLRKVGKTSILYQLGNIRTKDLVAYVDLQASTIKDCKFILWAAVNKWLESDKKMKDSNKSKPHKLKLAVDNYASVERLPEFEETLRLFDEDVRTLVTGKSEGIKLILFVDEIELITPSTDNRAGWTGALEMFRYLRGTAQINGKRFVPIIAGANPWVCENPQWNDQDNPVFQFFEEVFIPLLSEADCKELIVKIGELMNVTYEQSALDIIFKAVGGHPFFTRRLCSHIINMNLERPLHVTDGMVEDAKEEFLIKEDAVFTEIVYRLNRDFPEELEILKWVARGDDIKELKQLIGPWNASIKHLEGYQLLERVRKPSASLRIKIELFEEWLKEM